jgi:hypothetical protein
VYNVIGFVDGVTIPIQCPETMLAHEMYYNGAKGDTVVNNVIAFSPKGTIFHAVLNQNGRMHDALVSHPFLEAVQTKLGDYAVCVGQGFTRSGAMQGKFVGPCSKKAAAKFRTTLFIFYSN